jgi:nitrogen regulatory protein PII
MYIVLLVIDDPGRVEKVIEALEASGVTGATIIESTGMHRKIQKQVPLRYLYACPDPIEIDNYTIFAIVPNRESAENCREVVEKVVGDLDQHDTGIFAAWELDLVKGVHEKDDGGGQA